MRNKLAKVCGKRFTFYGTITEKRKWDENGPLRVCFEDVTFRDGRYAASHLWMNAGPFKLHPLGTRLRFKATVTQYVKWNAGRLVTDYTLRKPSQIKRVDHDDYN